MHRIEAWLFAPGDPRRLAAVRIGLCGVLAARLWGSGAIDLGGQPPALFRPISFMRLVPAMPGRPVAVALQVVGVGAALVAAAGLAARLSLPVAWGCGVALGAMATSTGKVVHNDLLLLLCLVPLLAAPVGDVWSIDALRRRKPQPPGPSARHGWPVRTAMVVVAGAYFFTGLAKLEFSGPAWFAGDNLRWVLYAASDAQRVPNALALFIADRAWLAHAMALATVAVEIGFPLVLWRPRVRWILVPGVILLHLSIRMTMGLDYSAWVWTVLVVMIDWPGVVDGVRSGRYRLMAKNMAMKMPTIITVNRMNASPPSSIAATSSIVGRPRRRGP